MQILIHDERPDELEFLPDGKVYSVYKADIGAGGTKLIDMVSGERYSVVLTNEGYEEVDLDQHPGRKSACLSTTGIRGNVLRKWTQKWMALFQKSFETLKC